MAYYRCIKMGRGVIMAMWMVVEVVEYTHHHQELLEAELVEDHPLSS